MSERPGPPPAFGAYPPPQLPPPPPVQYGSWPYPPPYAQPQPYPQPQQYAQPYPPQWHPQYGPPPAHWQAYRPLPYAAPPRSSNRGLFAGLAAAGLVVLLLFSLLAVAVHRSVAAVAAGQPGPGAPADQDSPVRDTDLHGLLDRQGRALHSGDEATFLAAYDPADPALIARQRMVFANLRKIPFTVASFSLSVQSADLQAGPAVAMDVDVFFVHQITGVDIDRVFEGYRWRVTRKAQGAPLVITSVGGTPSGSGYAKYLYYPAPWDQVPLTVIRQPHVLVLANPGTAALARTWAPTAETSAKQDLAQWSGRSGGAPGFLVMFEDLRSRFYGYWDGTETGTSWEAAYTMSLPGFSDTDGELDRAVGSRIVSYTGSSFYQPGHDPGYMFSHEMAHALVAPIGPRSGARTPLYIVEGFARFMETRHRSARPFLRDPALAAFLKKGFTGHLPTDEQLRSANDDVAGAAYELSLLVYLFIEHKLGPAKCLDLVNDAYETPTAGGGAAALTRATGMSVPAVEAEWVIYVHQRVG